MRTDARCVRACVCVIITLIMCVGMAAIASAAQCYLERQLATLAVDAAGTSSTPPLASSSASSTTSVSTSTTTSGAAVVEVGFDRELATLQRGVYDCIVTALGRFNGMRDEARAHVSRDDVARVASAPLRLALFDDDALLPLCLFFGHRRTLDMLVPLLIAFLNDASWQLRRAFFTGVVALAPFVGRHAVDR
jgi:hypothetical protein